MGKPIKGRRPQVTDIRINANLKDMESIVRTIHQYIQKADRHGVVNIYVDGEKSEILSTGANQSLLE